MAGLAQILLTIHIATLGYWLGAELVINRTFRFVAYRAGMPFADRDRLLRHVFDVDQHVRYALVLQAGTGVMLSIQRGWFPGGGPGMLATAGATAAWLLFVEAVHRLRMRPFGGALAAVDRGLRYVLIALLPIPAAAGLGGSSLIPSWLAWKLAAFAAVVAAGVGIRLVLIDFSRHWQALAANGTSPALEDRLRRGYRRATGVLLLLWVAIAVMVALSLARPA